mgnify:CR=1 FL=1
MNNKLSYNQNTIKIEENDLGVLYYELGTGVEGTVYKYSDNKVIKVLNREEVSIDTIIYRVNYFINIKVKNVVFPEDLVYNSKNEVIGYSMKLIIPNEYKSFFNLYECKDNKKFINYFERIQETMKELHKKNIFIGDFNPNNIMIDNDNNPVFIDTINYATPEFSFLLEPYNSMIYEKVFKRKCSLLDNDKFMFAFLLLSFFVSFNDLEKAIKNPDYFKKIINDLDISSLSKSTLNKIFSQNDEKEYIDIVLNDLRKSKQTKYDNKFGKIIQIIFN